MEQNLYAEENIHIPGSAFVDNQPTLDLLELKGTGVFSMTDEEINVPRGSDEGLLKKILANHVDKGKHPNCIRPGAKQCKDFLMNFGILHYAGPVFYNVTNFLEKNKDILHQDIIDVLQASNVKMISDFFPPDPDAGRGGGGRGGKGGGVKKTLGGQFKTQLNDLIATLNSTFPHFVRCMKSNDKKVGGIFTAGRMLDQLRYAGLVEVCRIRKLGYPVRRPFDEFFKRYRCIDLLSGSLDALNAVLSKKGVLKEGEWAKGKTRMFLRTTQSAELEIAREKSLEVVAVVVQKYSRRMLQRNRMRNYRKIITDLVAAIKKREEVVLSQALDMSFELPWGGGHIKCVKEAKLLLVRLKEEKRVTSLLENAISSRDLNALKSAIAVHAAVDPPFITPLADQAKEIVERLEAEAAIKAELAVAMSSRNKAQLQSLVAKANAMKFNCTEVNQASTLIIRLEQEDQLCAGLTDAMKRENLKDLNSLLSRCMELGMTDLAVVSQAAKLKDELVAREIAAAERAAEEERQRKAKEAAEAKRRAEVQDAKDRLLAAIESKDVAALNAAIDHAISISASLPEVDTAHTILDNLVLLNEAQSKLQAAIKVLQVKSETGIMEADLAPLIIAIESAEKVTFTGT